MFFLKRKKGLKKVYRLKIFKKKDTIKSSSEREVHRIHRETQAGERLRGARGR